MSGDTTQGVKRANDLLGLTIKVFGVLAIGFSAYFTQKSHSEQIDSLNITVKAMSQSHATHSREGIGQQYRLDRVSGDITRLDLRVASLKTDVHKIERQVDRMDRGNN